MRYFDLKNSDSKNSDMKKQFRIMLFALTAACALTACKKKDTEPEKGMTAAVETLAQETKAPETKAPETKPEIVVQTTAAATTAAAPATVKPISVKVFSSDGTVLDGIYPVELDPAKVKSENGKVTLDAKLYSRDIYNGSDISKLRPGKKVLYRGEEVTVKTMEEEKDDSVLINGGYDKGGITFVAEEGGTYGTMFFDDYSFYTEAGEASLVLGPNPVLSDLSDLSKPNGTVYTGAEAISKFMKEAADGKRTLNFNNVTLNVKKNQVDEIVIRYVP